jgi:hypothetical protein
MLKMPVILLGFTGALLLSPAGKAQQEVTSDHFTDSGVLNVYESAASKVAATTVKQTPATLQARKLQPGSASTLQPANKRGSSLPAKPESQAAAEKRKPAPTQLKKP